jgi:hypothetical protein
MTADALQRLNEVVDAVCSRLRAELPADESDPRYRQGMLDIRGFQERADKILKEPALVRAGGVSQPEIGSMVSAEYPNKAGTFADEASAQNNRDGIAQQNARQIERIFDRWLHDSRAGGVERTPAWIEQQLRKEWWLNHGCPFSALYGDDGEMQCSACAPTWDFRRTPLEQLREHVGKQRILNAARGAVEPPAQEPDIIDLVLERFHTWREKLTVLVPFKHHDGLEFVQSIEALRGARPSPPPAEWIADMKELERIYSRDGIASVNAHQIKKIFDKWLYSPPPATPQGEQIFAVYDAKGALCVAYPKHHQAQVYADGFSHGDATVRLMQAIPEPLPATPQEKVLDLVRELIQESSTSPIDEPRLSSADAVTGSD